MKTKDAEVLWR